jgi:small subunit ribosomal protein S17
MRTSQRKVRLGVVVSDRMQKTIVVQVRRLARHPVFPRVVKRVARFKAHDETNSAKRGDWVKIMETRPLSKDKRWRLLEIVRRGSTAPAVPGTEERPANEASVSKHEQKRVEP